MNNLNIIPQAIDIENNIIACLFFDIQNIINCKEKNLLSSDFYLVNNQLIYQFIIDNNINDFTIINNKLINNPGFEGTEQYLTILTQDINNYIDIVLFKSHQRQLLNTLNNTKKLIYDDKNITDVVDYFNNNTPKQSIKLNNAFENTYNYFINRIDNPKQSIEIDHGYSFPKFNKQDLIYIGARPSMGKTTFGLNLYNNINLKKMFISLEMSNIDIVCKLLSINLGIDTYLIKNLHLLDQQKQLLILEKLEEIKLNSIIIDNSLLTISNIDYYIYIHKPEIVFIDYVGLIDTKQSNYKGNKNNELSDISKQLKLIAKKYNIIVVCLTQLNRGNEYRINKKPILSDIRDSGGLEQDGDIIIMLHRDDYYNDGTDILDNKIDVLIKKNRLGELGEYKYNFNKKTGLIN